MRKIARTDFWRSYDAERLAKHMPLQDVPCKLHICRLLIHESLMPEAYRKTEAEADIATMGWAEECVPDIWHKRHYITLTGILEVGVVNLAPLEPVSCSLGLTCLQSNLTSGHAPHIKRAMLQCTRQCMQAACQRWCLHHLQATAEGRLQIPKKFDC